MRLIRTISLTLLACLFLSPLTSGRIILVPIAPSHWGGYEFGEDWWADTGDFLGWIRPNTLLIHYRYVYVLDLGTYIFLPESNIDAEGGWAYVFDGVERPANPDPATTWGGHAPGTDGFYDTGHFLGKVSPVGDFVYVADLNGFAYLPEHHLDGAGAWVYFYKDH